MARHTSDDDKEVLKARLGPVPVEERPLPPKVPAPLEWTGEAQRRRLDHLRERGAAPVAITGEAGLPAPETLRGNIEQYIGMAMVPIGLIGPLRVNGLKLHGDVYVPLATSEGALVASYDRGARILSRSGGATCLLSAEAVHRAPGFAFESLADAAHFAVWVNGEVEAFRRIAESSSRHARLLDMLTHIEGNHVYLIFSYHTGDAAGQNMVTFCTAAICRDLLERAPVTPTHWFLEANLSGDKRASAQSFQMTRGRHVTAEAVITRKTVRRYLRTTPERMCEFWRMGLVGGVQSGSIGVSGHIANGVAALFLATGQDMACVSEAAVGITRFEMRGEDLYCAVTLPNLIVGTVGGGTRLPTARDCLEIMDCVGDGKAGRLAEICAAVALAGEISIAGALCSGEFADAHRRLGRDAP